MRAYFNLWDDWLAATRMVEETLGASTSVVARRGRTIADAARDPLHADHAELGRMVSEKRSAFAQAGGILAMDWTMMQADLSAQGHAIGALLLGKRLPTAAAATAILSRSARINRRALASPARALRPIHRVAVANQRRLAKQG